MLTGKRDCLTPLWCIRYCRNIGDVLIRPMGILAALRTTLRTSVNVGHQYRAHNFLLLFLFFSLFFPLSLFYHPPRILTSKAKQPCRLFLQFRGTGGDIPEWPIAYLSRRKTFFFPIHTKLRNSKDFPRFKIFKRRTPGYTIVQVEQCRRPASRPLITALHPQPQQKAPNHATINIRKIAKISKFSIQTSKTGLYSSR